MGDSVIDYINHLLELEFIFTIQKVQDLTFDKVILALELLKGKIASLLGNFCIAFSRVRAIDSIRCLPLSKKFNRRKFLYFLPNVNTTRQLIDAT